MGGAETVASDATPPEIFLKKVVIGRPWSSLVVIGRHFRPFRRRPRRRFRR